MKTQLYLTPADHGRALTLEEFTTASAQEGYRYEIIHGRLYVSPAPNMPHDVIITWLARLLDRYTEKHPEVFNYVSGRARIFLPESDEAPTAPEPDLACYRDIPLDLPLEDLNWRDYSPILVVEVLSEETAEKDLERNRGLYLLVPSIREYWIIDPRASASRPTLLVYRRRGLRWERLRTVPPGGTYTTPLLPEFSFVVKPRA